ncbi:MAG: 23S rRNA (uracil(1939)-C(5))-methyltransferase RlmD [Clostridia bacterium]|nr:23S rRNA (uracil(1939)-C(5))-methyltransferase RlmD [Clostridia bacterium]MBQ2940949.1 23S rRNA (uracil(1939)-C(5))-methyltransferase RlmD [Clostridia bacterium]
MQKNEIYEVEITGMTEEGDGVGRIDGVAVFVPHTIVGEKVQVLIVKVLKNYAYGKLLEVQKPSFGRRKAECPHFYQCGGCQLWHMDTETELAYKRQKVTDCLRRIGKLDIDAEPVEMPSEEVRYRNKAQFPVTPEGMGLYRRNSHNVIPVEDCLIQGKWNQEILKAVTDWMEEFSVPAYEESTHSGLVRHIYTRNGESGILVTLVTAEKNIPHRQELIDRLRGLSLPIAGIVQNVNEKPTNVVLGYENHTLWGDGCLTDSIGKVKFQISPLSFYQVNPKATLRLYELAKEFADLSGKEVLWDLYCGIGTIGLFMADKAKKVVGVEVVPDAIENAKANARLNGIDNAEFYCGKAESLAPRLVQNGEKPDVVILDPPRKGCEESLLKTVTQVKPKRIVYVSCKPSTLARDLKYLTEHGYSVKPVVPVNMFPKTSHVETVTLLVKEKGCP